MTNKTVLIVGTGDPHISDMLRKQGIGVVHDRTRLLSESAMALSMGLAVSPVCSRTDRPYLKAKKGRSKSF